MEVLAHRGEQVVRWFSIPLGPGTGGWESAYPGPPSALIGQFMEQLSTTCINNQFAFCQCQKAQSIIDCEVCQTIRSSFRFLHGSMMKASRPNALMGDSRTISPKTKTVMMTIFSSGNQSSPRQRDTLEKIKPHALTKEPPNV